MPSNACATHPRPVVFVHGLSTSSAIWEHQVEALTANLISVNRRYKAHAGVQVTGLG